MENIHIDNFKAAISNSEKAIYLSFLIAVFVWTIAQSQALNDFNLPILGFNVEAKKGVLIVMLLYMALGAQSTYCLKVAKDNMKKINCPYIRSALLMSPSVLNGALPIRILAVVAPFMVLFSAMYMAFAGHVGLSFLVAGIYSIFHFVAASYSIEVK
ncbi:hypothetical protein [Saccharophagus degradans]|uniref:hypothetical protein n=1 Tax=Saccharophagus degradans TaxID=86304 RepID=UPI00059CAD1C|nr:hypothetical protein [Saccharophagus degradans]